MSREIYYSEKYEDEEGYEYRHVHLPKQLARLVPTDRLMPEEEWRRLGIQQSRGWEHYMIFEPEPHIVLFRRKLPNGKVNDEHKANGEVNHERVPADGAGQKNYE
ncbi:Cyclin-dependent kinase regulatory subunit [Trichuris suis]|nr:Cyclin-dependent kinase regulatory subunit [Trichuris suis]